MFYPQERVMQVMIVVVTSCFVLSRFVFSSGLVIRLPQRCFGRLLHYNAGAISLNNCHGQYNRSGRNEQPWSKMAKTWTDGEQKAKWSLASTDKIIMN